MFATERRNVILEILQEKKRITVKDLSKMLEVSEATLRSDLSSMENQGLLTRTHGGAVLDSPINSEHTFSERKKKNRQSKVIIAKEAVKLINEKDCILLDASTTALEIARILKEENMQLTVLTNGISAAIELRDNPSITVILLGGMLRNGSMALEGEFGLNILNQIHVDTMFTSARGFTTEEGLTDFSVFEVELKKNLVKRVEKVIAIIDHSKIGDNSIASFAKLDDIDIFVSENEVDEDLQQSLEQHQVQFILAD
ncbi:DeoR family transcriptional regulator [Gracilibacillus halophilus YIM-C55.5]|uniref:DeoR family transcriptional regulator n=1 Tax=Gracilibacillus halophilus YIM-C55.5 TaxID=1308866 RepID=N4WN03_9BACI|nr:DeoR/GlpR family DNA-binding transcription regulator [Gracilibacillus halophilus]ENH95895.1 DeoR family transcriptional regulator [Gracilibacillus halophilus YIM-C55.5]